MIGGDLNSVVCYLVSHPEEYSIDEAHILNLVSAITHSELVWNKEVPKTELYSSGLPSPEAVDELHN